ncbi:lipopolysaccharide ABC transporter permease [Salinivirga cyanobacteriivorans]|uniref:Lipopolysaccharide ABC transporter permease n=1 Tax=Salinivirga cyanobacteriivorans TaxID=1307839 RepID=A0A0S2HX65_9BACT|nr:LptF/LptG family permease [Salinivirga cyanobacteriivorans]ALO14564.1 lipopolysaccharide ABC transporter permease [Salinivirga cyanobacteriivorans]
MLTRLDRYIIKKFLGTFFYAIGLIILIVIVFDLSEKVDNFIESNAPWDEIIFSYYLNFIPYFVNMFSSLFTFIAVIFFTSKMAGHSEIIAILSSGVTYARFARPYLISALILALLSFVLLNWIIPPANQKRLEFEEKYVDSRYVNKNRNIHRQIAPGKIIYFSSYNTRHDIGHKFSIERYENGDLKEKLMSDYIKWDTTDNKWKIVNYRIRKIDSLGETIERGTSLDTALNMKPEDFRQRTKIVQAMNIHELNDFIAKQKMRGSGDIVSYEIERHKRFAFPFSTFILAIIGMALSSRKTRGGIGLNIGLGIALTFTYIMFQQVTTVFAVNASLNPALAVWVPNIVYALIALLLFKRASK